MRCATLSMGKLSRRRSNAWLTLTAKDANLRILVMGFVVDCTCRLGLCAHCDSLHHVNWRILTHVLSFVGLPFFYITVPVRHPRLFALIGSKHSQWWCFCVSVGADCYLDILSCEISCESLQQVQSVWATLSKRFQSEEEPLRIVALWDGFAQEEERRCSKIVLCMDCFLPSILNPTWTDRFSSLWC